MHYVGKFFLWLISLGLIGMVLGFIAVAGIFVYYSKDLPDYSKLKDYEPPVVTRVHTGDGRLLAEFAQENRIFVPVEEMPDLVKNAFIAAEDKNFYTHKGVDPMAIVRAIITNVRNRGKDARPVGASTITQQVIKNFLLSNEVRYERKIKEALIAYRIENSLSKDRILELYLNQIYLGYGSHGVASAALNYFDKSLDELTVPEVAYLAALPKAPNNYHPVRKYDAAIARRNWVIERMLDENFVTKGEAEIAEKQPLGVEKIDEERVVNAPYFAEEIRREMVDKFGSKSIYEDGLSIRSTLSPQYQKIAAEALRQGLEDYDRARGWRGPVKKEGNINNVQAELQEIALPEGMLDDWSLAMVMDSSGTIALSNGKSGTLGQADLKWTASNPLKSGQIIMVKNVKDDTYSVKQVPQIQGGIVAIDPQTGRVLAMQGGWKYGNSQYNRVTQAKRQPGSAFKPFVYLTALQEGLTPSTLVQDAPFRYVDTAGNVWEPKNYSNQFYGPTPIRVGVEKSRNLMTVRLAEYIGMDKVADTAEAFGIYDELKPHLANALGAGETTLLRLTNAYGMLVNGGKKLTPIFIDRIQNRYGETVYKFDNRKCVNCGDKIRWQDQNVPNVPDAREQVGNPQNIYQIVSIMEGVVERGTGQRLRELNRPLAGKTGTTNESKDTWFIGFSPDLVVGVYVGMDTPKPLGKSATGSSLALPIFKNFMAEALKDKPATPFRIPENINLIRVDPKTGLRVSPLDENAIWEAFVEGTDPDDRTIIVDKNAAQTNPPFMYEDEFQVNPDNPFQEAPIYAPQTPQRDNYTPSSGTGGLY